MAPGSRGVGAVFVHCFSGEDSGQTGDATGEPRVPRRSRSRYLSNAPGLADQLVASRKDSAREGGCPGGKTRFIPSAFFLQILSQFARVFDLAPDVGFRRSWYRRKACAAYFCKVPICGNPSLDFVRYGSREQRPPECFWACGSTCCESGRLCAQAWQRRWENSGIFSTALFRRPVFTCVVDVAPDIGFRRSWYRRKACATYFPKVQALHRGELGFARYDLANGGRWNVPYAKGFWSGQRSGQNLGQTLGQTWSNLVKALRNSGKCIPDHVLRVFGYSGPQSGSETAWSNLGQTWSTLQTGQTWSTSGKCALVEFEADLVRAASFCVPTPEKIPGFACHSLSDALALNRLTHGSKVKVGFRFLVFSQNSTFPTSAFSFPSSSDLALRKSVRPFDVRAFGGGRNFENLKSSGPTVWHLNPNTLGGDLAWGLPKSQIEWSNGLAFESKHVGGDLAWGLPKSQIEWSNGLDLNPNTLGVIWLGDNPSLKSSEPTVGTLNPNTLGCDLAWGLPKSQIECLKLGGSTVWHLNPNTLRDDLAWGLPKSQIEWSNGLAFESKHVGDVNLRLRICSSLKLGGSTVWHLNPNTLRDDLAWGLPKSQIEWSNGLAFESKHVGDVNLRLQICSSLKLGGSTVWHLNPNTLRDDLAWGLPKSQIEWSNGLAFESKHVGDVNLRLQICSSLKLGGSTVWHLNPNTLRDDLAWGLPKSQIEWSNGLAFESKHVGDVNLRLQIYSSLKLGGSTVWHLNPNTLRDDLAWGLPKSQIEWSNGLAFESKHVGDVNLRLQIYSKSQIGGSTVWHLNPNTLRDDLAWGLPKSQIEWSNGLAFESKHVGDVNLRLQICSSLKLGGLTVWHLNPNTLRDDLAWGLPKSQIEWSNGLAFESKHVGEMSHRGSSGSGDRCFLTPLDSCECMNIEDAMRASIEVVVALSVGSECTCIPYFRLSYLIASQRWKNFAPVWHYLDRIPYSRASILSPIWEILQEVSIRLDDVDLQWPRNLPQYRPPCLLSVSMMRDSLSNFLKLLEYHPRFGRTKKEKLPQYQG
uniref:Uncharacterized protein n=1 Tax=Fagus sylvatica TaxID=28930 RepID=A0A2N9IV97_FAGSY